MNVALVRRPDTGSSCSVQDDEAHVWASSSDDPGLTAEQLGALLSPRERERAAAFHFDADRRRFLLSHAFLRDVLSRYLQQNSTEIEFTFNRHGKPSLAGHNSMAFNLSHSGTVAICAIAARRAIGADVERIRPVPDLSDLADLSFSPRERTLLRQYDAAVRLDAFFACWTRKEAYVKARGEGLSIPLDSFDVGMDPGAPAGKFTEVSSAPGASRWWWANVPVARGYAGAIVVEGSPARSVTLFDWNRPLS